MQRVSKVFMVVLAAGALLLGLTGPAGAVVRTAGVPAAVAMAEEVPEQCQDEQAAYFAAQEREEKLANRVAKRKQQAQKANQRFYQAKSRFKKAKAATKQARADKKSAKGKAAKQAAKKLVQKKVKQQKKARKAFNKAKKNRQAAQQRKAEAQDAYGQARLEVSQSQRNYDNCYWTEPPPPEDCHPLDLFCHILDPILPRKGTTPAS